MHWLLNKNITGNLGILEDMFFGMPSFAKLLKKQHFQNASIDAYPG